MKTLLSTLLLAFAVIMVSCGGNKNKATEEAAVAPETEIVVEEKACACEECQCTKSEDGKCTCEEGKCTKSEDGKCACEKCADETAKKAE